MATPRSGSGTSTYATRSFCSEIVTALTAAGASALATNASGVSASSTSSMDLASRRSASSTVSPGLSDRGCHLAGRHEEHEPVALHEAVLWRDPGQLVEATDVAPRLVGELDVH